MKFYEAIEVLLSTKNPDKGFIYCEDTGVKYSPFSSFKSDTPDVRFDLKLMEDCWKVWEHTDATVINNSVEKAITKYIPSIINLVSNNTTAVVEDLEYSVQALTDYHYSVQTNFVIKLKK